MEFVLIIAASYAFVGGVCAAMAFVISMWIDNKVLVCILPYIIFRILTNILGMGTTLDAAITGYIDKGLYDMPFTVSVYHFVWWISLLSILLMFSYMVNIEHEK